MEVQIEIAAAGSDMWQAVDTPTPVEDTGFDGPPAQVADAVAFDYADTLAHEDGEPGTQVRATVTRVVDHGELGEATETLGVSDIHVVAELPAPGGRPAIGGTVSTAIGTDRLAAVDAYAAQLDLTRAEAIRRLLDLGLGATLPLVTDGDRYPDGGQWLRVTATAPGWDAELGREALRTSVELIGPREGEERDTLWQVTLTGGKPTAAQIAAAARLAVAEYARHGDSYVGACSSRVDVAGD